jgi:hypothetical protein
MLVTADPPEGVMRPPSMAGRPAIIADGVPAPPVTFFAASKAFSKSVDATSAHDVTLVGDAPLKGGIILATTAVDKVLKRCMSRKEMSKSLEKK